MGLNIGNATLRSLTAMPRDGVGFYAVGIACSLIPGWCMERVVFWPCRPTGFTRDSRPG